MDETTQRGVETAATAGGPEVKLMARPEAGLGTLLRVTLLTLAVLVMAGAAPATAQEEGAEASQEAGQDEAGQDEASAAQQAPPPAPPTCEAPEHAEFDFWVGEWDVYRWRDEWDLAAWRAANPDATPAVNRISKLHDGCALREEYTTPRGYEGSSLNFYDRADGRWHQTWIDSTGTALYLSGGMEGDTMVLADDPPEGRPHSRISWPPQEDGSVRQTWEQSPDGETWQVVFDGRYVRRGGSE